MYIIESINVYYIKVNAYDVIYDIIPITGHTFNAVRLADGWRSFYLEAHVPVHRSHGANNISKNSNRECFNYSCGSSLYIYYAHIHILYVLGDSTCVLVQWCNYNLSV